MGFYTNLILPPLSPADQSPQCGAWGVSNRDDYYLSSIILFRVFEGTNGVAVVTIAVGFRVGAGAAEEQDVGVVGAARVEGRRPIVAVA